MPVDITFSTTPKTNQSEVSDKENSPINNSHVTKIEDYINKKYD